MGICYAIHGLTAHRRTNDVDALVERALWIQHTCRDEEFCVADRLIGPIGVCVTGHISHVWEDDCWSRPDEDGKRFCGEDKAMLHSLADPTDDEWRQLVANVRATEAAIYSVGDGDARGYCEAWMSHAVVTCVIYCDDRWAETARNVAAALGVCAERVARNHSVALPEPTTALIDREIAEMRTKLRTKAREHLSTAGCHPRDAAALMRESKAHQDAIVFQINYLRSIRNTMIANIEY